MEGAGAAAGSRVGDKTPDGGALYAKTPRAGRASSRSPSHLESIARQEAVRPARPRRAPRQARRRQTLEVSGPEGSYALARDGKGDWAFTQPLATQAGRWSVDGLLGTLERCAWSRSPRRRRRDLKPFGLDRPSRTVTLGLADGTRETLEIGSQRRGQEVQRARGVRPLVAVIPGRDRGRAGQGHERAAGAKRLLEVATYDVAGLRGRRAAGVKKAYARSTTKDKDGVEIYKWKRTAPDAKDLETNKVQDALFQIGGVDVQEFVDKPGAGRELRAGRARPEGDAARPGASPRWLELGEKDGAAYARRAGDARGAEARRGEGGRDDQGLQGALR